MDIIRKTKKNPTEEAFRASQKTIFPNNQNSVQPLSETKSLASKKKNSSFWLKGFFFFLVIFILGSLGYGLFWIEKINSVGRKINPESYQEFSFLNTLKELATNDYPQLKENNGRINILLLGIAGEKKPGQNLTDTIMVLSFNTKSHQVAMLSLPRDLFVEVPQSSTRAKINSVYQIGLGPEKNKESGAGLIRETVEGILDQKINYFVILNFEGFEKIIDAVGGVNIMNDRDIFDSRYPGPNYSYETFELPKGFHHLDGQTALRYARVRHGDPEGDFGRAKRQQQIMQATKNKIFSIQTLFNAPALGKIFEALENNIQTDIQPEEIGSFLELSKKMDTQNINNVVIDAWKPESFLKVAHIPMGGVNAFVLVPKTGNYGEIQEVAEKIFNLNEIARRKEEIQKENAKIILINSSGDPSLISKIKKTLSEHLNYKNIQEITLNKKIPLQEKTALYEIDPGAKPFTLDEISKTLSAQLIEDVSLFQEYSTKDADILIKIGKDLIEKYNMEEATIEEWQAAQEYF